MEAGGRTGDGHIRSRQGCAAGIANLPRQGARWSRFAPTRALAARKERKPTAGRRDSSLPGRGANCKGRADSLVTEIRSDITSSLS